MAAVSRDFHLARSAEQRAVGLIIDSTAGLGPDELAVLEALSAGVVIVPLRVLVGDQDCSDLDLSPTQVCAQMREGTHVQTSLPAVESFRLAYRELWDRGNSHLCVVTLSSQLSGTHHAAVLAADTVRGELPGLTIEVFDSATVAYPLFACAQKLLTVMGERSAAPMPVQLADYVAGTTRLYFVPESLEYLRRGGRVSHFSALLGTSLHIVPVLQLMQGRIEIMQRVRTLKRAQKVLGQAALGWAQGQGSPVQVSVLAAEGAVLPPAAQAFAAGIRELQWPAGTTFATASLSTVLTAHVGPGAVGLALTPKPSR